MIKVSGLTYSIAGTPILHDINATLPAGRITALIGPNGAGKSTLLHLISQQIPLGGGRITMGGLDLAKTTAPARALKMAVVGQQLGVASRIRIRDLVGFGRWPHNHGRLTAKDQEKISEALSHFDLIGLQDRFLDEVSGGQRQRAFIAMASAQDTDWLLLDEPLNNLDLHHARCLMTQLREKVDREGKSVVIVLHDLNYAISWADHVVALDKGSIAFEGPLTEVATTDSLSALYRTPVVLSDLAGKPFVQYHR